VASSSAHVTKQGVAVYIQSKSTTEHFNAALCEAITFYVSDTHKHTHKCKNKTFPRPMEYGFHKKFSKKNKKFKSVSVKTECNTGTTLCVKPLADDTVFNSKFSICNLIVNYLESLKI
jgi:hypothetical protein